MERAENLARILDVNETFARDSHGVKDWLPILRLHSDNERFFELYNDAVADNVIRFYIIDRRNQNSIAHSIFEARENARSLRHLLSLEIWHQLNVFWRWVESLRPGNLKQSNLSHLCGQIKDGCELHLGLADRTMYRDQVWLFYLLGAYIERCDQTTRLVDIKYQALLPSSQAVGSPVDISQWNALLRSAAAYHGYRRVYPRQMTPTTVSGFILFNPKLPRSITCCVRQIKSILEDLMRLPELQQVDFPANAISRLESLAFRPPEEVISSGLHEFLDEVQIELLNLSRQFGDVFFSHRVDQA